MSNKIKAAIIDFEATSKNHETARMVESSYTLATLNDGQYAFGSPVSGRWNPGCKIENGAKAVHGIHEEDVEGAKPCEEFDIPEDIQYFIAHNVDYDVAVSQNSTGKNFDHIKRIDTLAIARKLFAGTEESFTLGGLMYMIHGNEAREMLANAHNAEADTGFLVDLLNHIQSIKNFQSLEELYQFSELARIPDVMPFGKHKDVPLADLPLDYKNWVLKQQDFDKYIKLGIAKSMEKPAVDPANPAVSEAPGESKEYIPTPRPQSGAKKFNF